MATSLRTSPNDIVYYSAHRGPVFDTSGAFHHFARQCDPVHLDYGYWKFSTYDDDRRAYLRGLNNPEEVLKAQDAGDGDHEDIILRWVPGELHTTDSPRTGTPAAHLQAICDKKKLLGRTLAFRGAVPLYPISTDSRLPQSQVLRQEMQTGVLLDDPLSPALPFRAISPVKSPSAPSIPVKNPLYSTTMSPQTVSVPLSTLPVRQHQSRSVEPPRLEATPVVSSPDRAPVHVSPLIAAKETANLDESLHSTRDYEVMLSMRHNHRGGSLLGLQASKVEDMKCHFSHDSSNSIEKLSSVDGDVDAFRMHDSDETADGSTGRPAILSLASLTLADLFHAQVASLPCMDCGSLGTHTCDCWINKATLSLTLTEDLTTSALRRLADDVDKFDPGPWTTHFEPQQEVEEDGQTQLLGMVDVIRNFDATANDPELQGLDEQCIVLLWALKSIGEVEVLSG